MSLCQRCEHYRVTIGKYLNPAPSCKKHVDYPGHKTLCTEFRRDKPKHKR